METKQDLYYLKLFAALKWAKGFRCKKEINGRACGHTKAYAGKKPFSLRCKKCGHLETAIAGTAFNGLRMPISRAMKILIELKNNYSKLEEGDRYLNDDLKWIYDFPPRLPLRILAKKIKRTPKAIGVFIKRVGTWLPKFIENHSESADGFLKDLKSYKSKKLHARIFGLLYDDKEERTLKEIIYHLVFNAGSTKWHTYGNKMNDFFERLGDSYDFNFYEPANADRILKKWWESFLINNS
jgi:hypothetical protein